MIDFKSSKFLFFVKNYQNLKKHRKTERDKLQIVD